LGIPAILPFRVLGFPKKEEDRGLKPTLGIFGRLGKIGLESQAGANLPT